MDDQSLEIVKASAEGVAEGTTRAFLEAVLGPALEVGEWARDAVRFQRWRAQVKMLGRAKKILDDQGISPQAVPLKILVPLLDGSSLEDENDEVMTDRWAALLANAAAGELGADVLPSFPTILAELSSGEAQILDVLARQHVALAAALADDYPMIRPTNPRGYSVEVLRDPLALGPVGAHDSLFPARVANLARLGLCTLVYERNEADDDGTQEFDNFEVLSWVDASALGVMFWEACTPPPAYSDRVMQERGNRRAAAAKSDAARIAGLRAAYEERTAASAAPPGRGTRRQPSSDETGR